jgi:hypothetical protein
MRPNISYPETENRLHGFDCPLPGCGQEHAQGDCNLDVTLAKFIELARIVIQEHQKETVDIPIELEEQDAWAVAGVSSLRQPRRRILQGGRLLATFNMVEMGELDYMAEVSYIPPMKEEHRLLDMAFLERMKDVTRSELDCQVCYALYLDPLTTSCGHTFCRKCLQRVLDHTNVCPICRRSLGIAPSLSATAYPTNKRLDDLLHCLHPDLIITRAQTVAAEEADRVGELDTPLFVCALSFPSMPTFLHVFEPRYRLMIRRAIESGNHTIGMILHNPRREPQGELGSVPFYQYGTLLQIINLQMLPDGRSMVETTGLWRFKILRHGIRDGYMVGRVERVEDVSLTEEENIEAAEMSRPPQPPNPEEIPRPGRSRQPPPPALDLDRTSTKDLMEIATAFVQTMQNTQAVWLQARVLQIYGECPTDAALFPWWFASIFPIMEQERYRLLSTTSVRERLKVCVGWILRIEAQRM